MQRGSPPHLLSAPSDLPHRSDYPSRGIFRTIEQVVKALWRRTLWTENNIILGINSLLRRCLTMRKYVPAKLCYSYVKLTEAGIEPATFRLQGECSTEWANRRWRRPWKMLTKLEKVIPRVIPRESSEYLPGTRLVFHRSFYLWWPVSCNEPWKYRL